MELARPEPRALRGRGVSLIFNGVDKTAPGPGTAFLFNDVDPLGTGTIHEPTPS